MSHSDALPTAKSELCDTAKSTVTAKRGPTDPPAPLAGDTTCTARTAPANENEKVDAWTESDLAWELADAINPLLADGDRHRLYATIGCGDSYTGIDTMLQTLAHQGWPISPELIGKLNDWLNVYAQSVDAPRLHALIRAIKSLS